MLRKSHLRHSHAGAWPATRKERVRQLWRDRLKVNYICLQCIDARKISYEVVRSFELLGQSAPSGPPLFSCEKCGGTMYPEIYRSLSGHEYRIEDIAGQMSE